MSSETRCITGISARHGPHHAAQMFTTAGWPRSAARRLRSALRAPGRIWLAWLCNAASGAGEPLRRREISDGLRRVAAGGADVSFEADDSPTTRIATRAIAAMATKT